MQPSNPPLIMQVKQRKPKAQSPVVNVSRNQSEEELQINTSADSLLNDSLTKKVRSPSLKVADELFSPRNRVDVDRRKSFHENLRRSRRSSASSRDSFGEDTVSDFHRFGGTRDHAKNLVELDELLEEEESLSRQRSIGAAASSTPRKSRHSLDTTLLNRVLRASALLSGDTVSGMLDTKAPTIHPLTNEMKLYTNPDASVSHSTSSSPLAAPSSRSPSAVVSEIKHNVLSMSVEEAGDDDTVQDTQMTETPVVSSATSPSDQSQITVTIREIKRPDSIRKSSANSQPMDIVAVVPPSFEQETMCESEQSSTIMVHEPVENSLYNEYEDYNDTFYCDEDELADDEDDPFLIIKLLPPYHQLPPHIVPHNLLPPKDHSDPPFTLVLDLDETLVHSSLAYVNNYGNLEIPDVYDLSFKCTDQGVVYDVYVRFRPHMLQFLQTVCKYFEVVVYTASTSSYAEALLNLIDTDKTLIKYRLYRDSCLFVNGNYIKDLTGIGRDMSKTIIIDNCINAFGYHLDNGLPIISWFDDDSDTELCSVIPFLEILLSLKDVRPTIREVFRHQERVDQVVF